METTGNTNIETKKKDAMITKKHITNKKRWTMMQNDRDANKQKKGT